MTIAIISDSHLVPGARGVTANTAAVRDWVERLAPAFTLHLGDVTAEAAHYPEQLPAAAAALADWPGALYLLPGNHDIGEPDLPSKPVDEPVIDAGRLGLYRACFGQDRWSVVHAGWMLIGINAQVCGANLPAADEQERWLAATLAAHRGPVGLFLHKPMFRDDPAEHMPHSRYLPPAARARLRAMLAEADLRFVVSGHVHQYRRAWHDGVEYVWAPSCAFIVPDLFQERIGDKVVGVLTLDLTADGHDFALHVPPGLAQLDLIDQDDVYPGARERMMQRLKAR